VLPRLAGQLVPDPTPKIDDLLTPAIRTARASKFPAASEIAGKRLADDLKATTDVSLNGL
jgi:hypothetical protein